MSISVLRQHRPVTIPGPVAVAGKELTPWQHREYQPILSPPSVFPVQAAFPQLGAMHGQTSMQRENPK